MNLRCPECKTIKTVSVEEVRTSENEVYRRNRCIECGHVFYSLETEVEADKTLRDIWKANKKKEVIANGGK